MVFLKSRRIVWLVFPLLLLGLLGSTVGVQPGMAIDLPFRVLLPVAQSNYDGGVVPFGVTVDGLSVATADSRLETLADLGAKWTTGYYAVSWRQTQPTEGAEYVWSANTDQLIAKISQRNFTPIMVINGTPDWAALDPVSAGGRILNNGPIKEAYLDEFGAFVHAAVSRYSVPPYNVKHWEIYSEPDCVKVGDRACYAEWGNHGELYAAALRTAYLAAKSADPEATIRTGSLAYDSFLGSPEYGQHPREFLDQFIAGLQKLEALSEPGFPYYDVFSFNYFAIFGPIRWNDCGRDILGEVAYLTQCGPDILGKAQVLKAKLANAGIPDRPMASTEAGTTGEWDNEKDLETQARYVAKLHARGMSAGLKTLIWYNLSHTSPIWGLMYGDQPKPAYDAYRTMTSVLSQARFERVLTAEDVRLSGVDPSAFEGYSFRTVSGSKRILVVWANDVEDTAQGKISLQAESLTTIDKLGQRTPHTSGADGMVVIEDIISDDPVYIEMSR